MKWLTALLMIINVAVYLSVGSQSTTMTTVTSDTVNVNKDGMLLLSETHSETISAVSGTEFNEVSLLDIESIIGSDKLILETNSQSTQLTMGNKLFCYRVGPFKENDTWKSAMQWLDDQGINYNIASQRRELKAVLVYLGPFENIISANDTVSTLKVKKLNHFIYETDNGEVRISLGYFTQETLAKKFIQYLDSIDIDTQSLPEYRKLGPYNWLEVAIIDRNNNSLLSQSWPEKGVSVSQVDCRDIEIGHTFAVNSERG